MCPHMCPHVQQEAQGPLTSLGMSTITMWWWHTQSTVRSRLSSVLFHHRGCGVDSLTVTEPAGDLTGLPRFAHQLLFIRALLRRPSEPESEQEQPYPTVRLQGGHGKKGPWFPGLARSKQKSSQPFQKMARTLTVSMPTSGMCCGDQARVWDTCASSRVLSSGPHAAVPAVWASIPPGSVLAPCTRCMGWGVRATAAGACGNGWWEIGVSVAEFHRHSRVGINSLSHRDGGLDPSQGEGRSIAILPIQHLQLPIQLTPVAAGKFFWHK